ncbi:VOC family protein [Nocardioides sp. C4-1]|uniref:VOC family protein n=1 Tax=Nocardioides sp. C4-1 TaxID=3151851 RepID=UPI0032641F68
MAIVTWKDLCLDALDVDAVSRFWGAVSGLEVTGPVDHRFLAGPTPRHGVWVNGVDRPKRAKTRRHLDVDCDSVDDLVALGASVVAPSSETGFGWTTMTDPEGTEFCAFERGRAVPDYRVHGIGVDCADAAGLARWWGGLFGVEAVEEESWFTLGGVAVDDRFTLDFNDVPEPRSEPSRVHWDVVGDVAEVLAHGATVLWELPGWTTLADPEGNEFCVFAV